MARFGGLGFCRESIVRSTRFLLCVLGLAAGWNGVALVAQVPTAVVDGGVPTLHVYTNLIQIPTLVLGPHHERLKTPIAESLFSVSIDNGPWFRATHVRMEGDDPISLSILLDVSGGGAELMPKMADAIAALAPLSLHPKDHVSIYALDCSLVQSLNDVPAESGKLKVGVDKALESWMVRKRNNHGSNCRQSLHLWDALAYISSELYKLPGRRVILAVSQGEDEGSVHSWNELRTYAQATGVAVFGLTNFPLAALGNMWRSENPFHSLCELSGGLMFWTGTNSPQEQLKPFVTMVRERYIVEFPRPANSTSGAHSMEVKVAKSNDFIRSSGISVPIPDAAVLADPTTVPSDPTLTPELGTRKIMEKPQ
jgi:hypothetical protein